MGRGRPVVATGRGGSSEYLRDGENCLLFKADDERSLAAAITRLAGSPELRDKLRADGMETAAAHTEDQFNERVERALLEAVAEPAVS
jgi:glycosyltransferase involved in cell wall biosynthesis